jgi:hypothetical protein
MGVNYTPVGEPGSTFKQPRQKIWGVFCRPINIKEDYWEIVLTTNDLQEAKEKINDWLREPPVGHTRTGLNNVILTEIVPIDSNIEIG